MDDALAWVAEVTGAQIVESRRLTGGMSTEVRAITLGDGERVVLRRFLNERWLAAEPDVAVREAIALRALDPTAVPAPAFIGVDPRGERCGAPAVLMGWVDGERTLVDDLPSYSRELARAMAAIHDVAAPDGLHDERAWLTRLLDEERPNRHGGVPTAAFWSEVRDGAAHVTWQEPVLIHNDFHPGNVLFTGGALTGVVDWPLAMAGQPASDVAFCRLDAGLMLGVDAADAILAAYEAETGAPVPDRWWWDLVAASRAETDLDVWAESYAGLVDGLDVTTVRARFDAFVARARADRDGLG